MEINVSERFKRVLLRNIDRLFVVSFLIFILAYSLTRFSVNNIFSLSVMVTAIFMFIGQVLLFTPFWFSYPFYVFSFGETVFISFLIWLSFHIPNSEFAIPIYLLVVAVLIAVPLATHWLTRTRFGTISIIPIFSVFFFGLLIALSNTQTLASTSVDTLFILALVLFSLTSILGMNMAYRTMMLNRELKISDRNRYLRKAKEDLLKKHTSTEAKADIDLLVYYFSSSLDSFVHGDLDRSFMDAFKIIDNQGTAFKTIYTLVINKDQWKHLKGIRNLLSHVRITEEKKEEKEKKEDLQKLTELKKTLFRETLDVLKIVRFQFIDNVLKKE